MEKLKEKLKQLKQDLSGMSWKDRLDHLWTYYKFVLLIAVLTVGIIAFIVNIIITQCTTLVAGGLALNVNLTDEGRTYLEEEFYEQVKAPSGLQTSELNSMQFSDPNDASANLQLLYNQSAVITALVSSESLDYGLVDKIGLTHFGSQGFFADLRQFMTEEQLAQWEPYIVQSPKQANGTTCPMAIDISHLPFVKECIGGKEPVYFVIISNTPRPDIPLQLLDFLAAWEK